MIKALLNRGKIIGCLIIAPNSESLVCGVFDGLAQETQVRSRIRHCGRKTKIKDALLMLSYNNKNSKLQQTPKKITKFRFKSMCLKNRRPGH